MDFRGVLLVTGMLGGALFGLTTSCSGPDPAQITFGEPRTGGVVGTSGGVPTDGGGPPGDGGAPGDAAPADPVFGNTTFALGTPGRGAPAKAANAAHAGDSSGKDCIVAGCHQGGWAFGGTLYTDAAGTARVPGAEVRISGPDGVEYAKTYSDVDGNFWIDALALPIPTGSRVGVRTADKKLNMAATVGPGQAGCNQANTCHGGTAGKVFLK